LSAIHVTGNLVRIDLMTHQPQLKSDNGQPVFDISRRIIMPLEGFVQSLSVQEDIVNKLIAAGVVKRNPKPEIAAVQAEQQRLEQPQDEEKEG
jgi:hypothetical protein